MFALVQEKIKKTSGVVSGVRGDGLARVVAVLFFLGMVFLPQLVTAQSLVFPDCIQDGVSCGFNDFVEMISNVISFLLLLSIPIATLMFAWAGWMMITANGNSGKIDDAKEIFWDVLKGFVIALTAWLVVKLVTSALLAPDFLGDADLLGFIQTVLFLYS